MATLKPQDEFIKTALRLPRDLHKRVQEAAGAIGRSMNAEIIQALQSYYRDIDRENWENSDEYHVQLDAEHAEIEKEVAITSISRPHAIQVAEMTREQKQAFIASIDRSLSMPGTSDAERSMLSALRNAAQEEVAVINRQIVQFSADSSRTVLIKRLADTAEGVGKSRTPSIPGVNTPKRASKRKL